MCGLNPYKRGLAIATQAGGTRLFPSVPTLVVMPFCPKKGTKHARPGRRACLPLTTAPVTATFFVVAITAIYSIPILGPVSTLL